MKLVRNLAILTIVVTMPVSTTTYAGMPDLPLPIKDASIEQQAPEPMPNADSLGKQVLLDITAFDATPVGVTSHFVSAFKSFLPAAGPAPALPPVQLAGDETAVGPDEDIVIVQEEQGFWSRRSTWIAGSLLLVTGLVIGLIALFSGSGGGSGGSGSGGSGGGGGGGGGGALALGGGGGEEGGDLLVGGGPLGGGLPGGPIPANPEPSTLLLLGLGLLLPYLRKRAK